MNVGRIGLFLGQAVFASILLTIPAYGSLANDINNDAPCGYFTLEADDRAGPPIRFYADLSDDAQSAPTESPGEGRAELVLDRDSLKLTWRISYSDLTSQAIGLKMHGPKAPAVDASVLFEMDASDLSSPIEGERELGLGAATNLIQHLLYLNLQTEEYPEGELRGAIKKVRPEC